ncbi:hypothetical protein CKALI_01695 [Corynebacterium kalinowskii]|uniref:Uncharacterized protein n=1 Tax=Corynebacterium kalinowskii TaxID=2675216 RepID=A0A6B8W0H3_9CORY|nr:hypothetical protein [Corynebacterium kalinowskii]QGU01238.1 hypothetical protein CKALI_01695 [Corynebacterium kalinowskii]
MDLSVLKTQLADFGTLVENSVKFFANIGDAAANALMLLDGDTWTGFFDMTSSTFEFLSSEDSFTSTEINN